MKKQIIALLLGAAMAIAATACANQEVDPSGDGESKTASGKFKDTPTRVSKNGVIYESYDKEYPFDVVVNESEIIADITITEWLGEREDTGSTYFRAKVNKAFKGEGPDEITLVQTGYSKYTLSGHPLFKNGDRLLLGLSKTSLSGDYENKYCIHGDYTSIIHVVEHEGKTYLLSRDLRAELKKIPGVDFKDEELAVGDEKLRNVVVEKYYEQDPLLKGISEQEEANRDPALKNDYYSAIPVFDYNGFTSAIADAVKDGEAKQ